MAKIETIFYLSSKVSKLIIFSYRAWIHLRELLLEWIQKIIRPEIYFLEMGKEKRRRKKISSSFLRLREFKQPEQEWWHWRRLEGSACHSELASHWHNCLTHSLDCHCMPSQCQQSLHHRMGYSYCKEESQQLVLLKCQ